MGAAVKLGPVDTKKLKFSLEELERITAAASPSLTEPEAMPLRRPSTEKNLSECEDFDNMEEMYLLEDATHRPTQTATSYVDLAAASKALDASASQGPQGPLKALNNSTTASGSNATVSKAKAPSEASSQEYMDMNRVKTCVGRKLKAYGFET